MCGVVGLIGAAGASKEAFLGLTTLQHRGQDAAGILSYDHNGFHRVKNIGLVEAVFNRENMETLTGNLAIAHARYSTIGRGDLGEVQPFLTSYPFGIGMVHNGNIVNSLPLGEELRSKRRRHLLTQSDTEVILNLLSDGLDRHTVGIDVEHNGGDSAADSKKSAAFFEALTQSVAEIFEKANGSYSIVSLIAGHGLVAFRDPSGIRPLVWGVRKDRDQGVLESGEAHGVASESVALSFLGYENIRDLKPAEVLYIDLKGRVFSRILPTRAAFKPCMFEWVYFASPESNIDGVPVYGARIELGRGLADKIKKLIRDGVIEPDLIVPVPETSRIAAISLSEELKIPYREVLIKNRYIKRTFILDSQEKRQKAVNLKLSPVRSEIQGKKVMLVDDSIVRGTTSKKIVELVRAAGATRVYFVSTCPPIRKPCYYGIDFPVEKELIASGRTEREIESYLGADAVVYQEIEGLKKSICPSERFSPCTACLGGEYPTEVETTGSAFALGRTRERESRERGIGSV